MSKNKQPVWNYGKRSPKAFREWSQLRGALNAARCREAYQALAALERAAWARWLKVRAARQMAYLTGARRTPPPESCF